jgi:hypothetical protein
VTLVRVLFNATSERSLGIAHDMDYGKSPPRVRAAARLPDTPVLPRHSRVDPEDEDSDSDSSQDFDDESYSPPCKDAPPGARFLVGYPSAILGVAPPGYRYDPTNDAHYLPLGVDPTPFADWLPRRHKKTLTGVYFLDVPYSQHEEAKSLVRGMIVSSTRLY